MSFRDRMVIVSKKLAGLCFFGQFVYIFVAKGLDGAYGLLPEYAVFLFFATFFFLGLMTLPRDFGKGFFSSLLLPASFFLASLGGSMVSGRLILFHTTLEDTIVEYGAVAFIWSIVLMIAAAVAGDSGNYRSQNDIDEVRDSFQKAASRLSLAIQTTSTPVLFEMEAKGNVPNGFLSLKIENGLVEQYKLFNFMPKRKRNLISTSTLILNPVHRKIDKDIYIEAVNDALEIKGLTEEEEKPIRKFITEKQLNYFNFHLSATNKEVHITVDLAIEEAEAWWDYVELMGLL